MSKHFPYPDVVDESDPRLENMESLTNPFDLTDADDKRTLGHVIRDLRAGARPFLLVDAGETKVEVWAKPRM